jgi:hypothetical protein
MVPTSRTGLPSIRSLTWDDPHASGASNGRMALFPVPLPTRGLNWEKLVGGQVHGAWRQIGSADHSSLGPQQQRRRRVGRGTSRKGGDQVAEHQGTESHGHDRQDRYGRPGHDVDVGGEEIP